MGRMSELHAELHGLFGGSTYSAPRDFDRLGSQLDRVEALMADGAWRSLSGIRERCGGGEASISARLRDLRKLGKTVERRHVKGGLWEYRVV